MMDSETLDKSFERLIQDRSWYKNSAYPRKIAYWDKKLFLEGKLSDARKREYLKAAGYVCVQIELWQKSGKLIPG